MKTIDLTNVDFAVANAAEEMRQQTVRHAADEFFAGRTTWDSYEAIVDASWDAYHRSLTSILPCYPLFYRIRHPDVPFPF